MRMGKSVKVILVLILILLGLNLLNGHLTSSLFYIEAQAKLGDKGPRAIDVSNISGIACSADGQIVYVTGHFDDKKEGMPNRECIFRSKSYGKTGSWEMVAKQKIENF